MRRPCGCCTDPVVFGHRDCRPPALTWRTRYLRATANALSGQPGPNQLSSAPETPGGTP